MKYNKTSIDGVWIIEPRLFRDDRGYLFESFNQKEFEENIGKISFVYSYDRKLSYGTLEGLNYQQEPFTQSKLVSVVEGEILFVVVDIRKDSLTYGKHVAVELTNENHNHLFITPGFAHGFIVLSKNAILQCQCTDYLDPHTESILAWNDSALNIDWRIPEVDIRPLNNK